MAPRSWHDEEGMGICSSHESAEVVRVVITAPPPKLIKKESDLNLIPGTEGQVQRQWYDTDESKYDREKHLIVVCPHVDKTNHPKIVIYDVDHLSSSFGSIISELELPLAEDEVHHIGWLRNAATMEEVNAINRSQLIVSCYSSSRIYIVTIDDSLNMRVSKCFTSDDLKELDTSYPLMAFGAPGKNSPIYISTMGDKYGSPKGNIIRIDKRTMFLFDRKNNEEKSSAVMGGFLAPQPKQNIMVTTELGDPNWLFATLMHGKSEINGHTDSANGCKLNVWQIFPFRIRQTIELDEFDASMIYCVRFCHNIEVNHGFACSALGSAIFHLYKNSLTGNYHADKVAQFSMAHVEGWIKDEMPAMPVDMVISMDDRFLYVSCWLHGFIAQFNITDPFRVSVCSKNFIPERRIVRQTLFEGGPSNLQLSLDGRRLYVNNSLNRQLDEKFFPDLINNTADNLFVTTIFGDGSIMALIHVNTNPSGGMELDENFVIKMNGIKNGPYLAREMRFLNGDSTSDAFIESINHPL